MFSRTLVEPSMSVKRNVTVPLGGCVMTLPRAVPPEEIAAGVATDPTQGVAVPSTTTQPGIRREVRF
jgi:hypothetical protein